jgi:RHS repeat-associated protein
MGRFYRVILTIAVFAAIGLVSAPVEAKNIGADPPVVCTSCGCAAPSGANGNCSSYEPCSAGTCFSRTEGNVRETYPIVSVKSSTGAMLSLSLTYDSYNADTSRARFNTVLGIGWTHSYNLFLFSQVGNMFRVDGDGRVTKYQLGPGGKYTAAPGYFEAIVKNPDGSFTITDKYKTVTHYVQIAGTHFMQGTPVWRLVSVTDRNNNVTILSYSGGNLTNVADTYGRTITFSYNSHNLITSITDPLSRVTSFTYDSTGTQLATITDPAGKTTQYTYNLFSQITSKTDKDGRVFTYSYTNNEPTSFADGTGAPYFSMSNPTNWATDPTQLAMNQLRQYTPSTTSKTDGNGNVWKYGYDLHGYITSTVAPDGATWNYTYDPATLMPASQTDADGNTTKYQYDTQGNLIQKTDASPFGFVTTYTYEPVFNQMTSMTDPNGRTTSYAYDSHGNRTSMTDPLAGVESWTYDPNGNVLTDTDKNGNTTSYVYDGFGNRIQTTDPLGNLTKMTYDAVGNLTSQTDPNIHTTGYAYDALDRIIIVTDPLLATTTTVYDGQGNRIQVTDRDGNTTQYQYDQRSRLVKETDALSQTTTITYDGNNNVLAITDKDGHTTMLAYDGQNRLIRTIDALGDTSTMSYDPVGNKLTDTDANGHTTTYTYDALNRKVTSTDAVSSVTTLGYDGTGPCPGCTGPTKGSSLISKRSDGDGKVIYYKYDGLDRLIREVHKQASTADTETPNDAVTVYTYDPVDNRLTRTEPDGNTTTYTYDADNRLIKVVNAAGDTTLTAYDPVGNVASITEPTTNVIANTYDPDDRVIQIQDGGGIVAKYSYDPEGRCVAETDGNGNTTTPTCDATYRVVEIIDPLGKNSINAYDPVGNLLSTTDRNGNVTTYTYDAINRRVSMTDALGDITEYQYDPVGNVTAITDANGHTTACTYDAVNRRVKETYADGLSRTYTYDFVGNLTSRTDQNGNTTTYTYSDLYFLLQRTYPISPPDTITYDLSGRMLTAMRGGWLVTFTYDGANRVTQSVQNGQMISYTYNLPSRVETIAYPGGRTITQSMDRRGRLSRSDDPSSATPIVQYNYDSGNRVRERDYRNGTATVYSYNANDWITNLQHNSGANSVAGFSYTYDNEGNKRFEQKLQDTAHSEAYQYDNIYRLITYQVGTLVGSTIPVPVTQTKYTLDPVANWTSKVANAIPQMRTHNAVNEITTIDSSPLAYDKNGNLTADALYSYAYDEENRLIAVTRNADSAVVGQYQYDALFRRVQKIANPSGTATTTRYFYDDTRIVEEQDGSAGTQATYVYGNYVDEVLTMDRGGQTYYYHQNALWSVEAITNSTAAVVERYAYDAYGAPTTSPSAIGNPYLFTGRQLDAETGLYFYRARYYDPVKGRFIQRDPLEYVDGMNLYEYVASNPLAFIDPLGIAPFTWNIQGAGKLIPKDNTPKLPWNTKFVVPEGASADKKYGDVELKVDVKDDGQVEVAFKWVPNPNPKVTCPCGGKLGWVQHITDEIFGRWRYDNAAEIHATKETTGKGATSDPSNNPKDFTKRPENGQWKANPWYGGAGNITAEQAKNKRHDPVEWANDPRPQREISDTPKTGEKLAFITQLVCEGNGNVIFQYAWAQHVESSTGKKYYFVGGKPFYGEKFGKTDVGLMIKPDSD